jgi:hypothetical protein
MDSRKVGDWVDRRVVSMAACWVKWMAVWWAELRVDYLAASMAGSLVAWTAVHLAGYLADWTVLWTVEQWADSTAVRTAEVKALSTAEHSVALMADRSDDKWAVSRAVHLAGWWVNAMAETKDVLSGAQSVELTAGGKAAWKEVQMVV